MSEETTPLYRHIFDDIMDQIRCGKLQPGDKLPTEFELIDQYGVSRITVTRALQELVKTGMIERYRSRGSFVAQPHDYESNKPVQQTVAQTVPGNYKNTIALVLPFSSDNIPPLLFSVQRAVQENGYMLAIFNSEKNVEKEGLILQQLINTDVAGIICHPIESFENICYYSRILLCGTPLVTIDKSISYLDIPSVKTDNFTCAYKAMEYLIRMGHRNVAYYCHTLKDNNESLRFSGYLKAMIDNGITPNEENFLEISPYQEAQSMLLENNANLYSHVNRQLKKLMSRQDHPTAIFCAFDLIAVYVEQQISKLNVRIPEELSILGFDNLPICNQLQIPLTSMSQDFESIGCKAVDLILKQIGGEKLTSISYLYNGSIVERNSVKNLSSDT